jgi:6-phosphogluconolactonase
MKPSPTHLWIWRFQTITSLIILGTLAACASAQPVPSSTPSLLVFAGTYTSQNPEGIFVYRLDPASGALSLLSKTTGLPNPSYLTIDPGRRYLIAVSETDHYLGQPGGAVSSYRINSSTGELTLINSQPTGGANPCYVSVDPSGKWVFVANYSGGSVAVLPLGDDGRLGAPAALVQHSGSSINPDRQEAPHAHSIQRAPASQTLVLAADLGLDKVLLYDLDPAKGSLSPHAIPFLALKPGAGPRHFTFHPTLPYLYIANELDSSLTVFNYDAKNAAFQENETLSLLPADFKGQNGSADIHITPDGKFLYASNRGHDSLAMFAIDGSSGKLTALGYQPSGGKTPRNFAIDPSGTYLLAANQDSGTIVTFRIDKASGKLTPAGPVTHLDQVVCLQFMEK